MKKFLCFLLSAAMLVCLAGCGGNRSDDASSSESAGASDNELAAAAGKIPELAFALGADPDAVRESYEDAASHSEESEEADGHVHEIYFDVISGEKSVVITTGSLSYYYEKEKKDNGISVICSQEAAYGFVTGITTKQEVEAAFAASSGETVEATEDDMFFLISPVDNCLILRYGFEDYRLDFYFSENVLIATVLMDTVNWTL